jgi:hypothetical protein
MSTTATKEKTTTQQEPKAGRDARGRFTKGNKGGPGNPFAREVAVLRATMIHAFTPKIFMRLVEVLRQRAEGGDMVAMKLILQYVLGKPAETLDPDRIAIDEWQKLRDAAVSLDETSAVLEQVPATMACFLLKKFWPDETVQHVREALQEDAQAKAEADEDERYVEEREKAEEEARRRRAGSGDPRPTAERDARPTAAPHPGRPTPAPSTDREINVNASHQSPERKRRVASPVAHASGSFDRNRIHASAGGNGDRPPSPYGALGKFLMNSDLPEDPSDGKRSDGRR